MPVTLPGYGGLRKISGNKTVGSPCQRIISLISSQGFGTEPNSNGCQRFPPPLLTAIHLLLTLSPSPFCYLDAGNWTTSIDSPYVSGRGGIVSRTSCSAWLPPHWDTPAGWQVATQRRQSPSTAIKAANLICWHCTQCSLNRQNPPFKVTRGAFALDCTQSLYLS